MSGQDIKTLPLILLKSGGSSLQFVGGNALTLALSTGLSAAADASVLSPLVAEDLLRHLHRKLHETYQAQGRAGWFGGKLYNWAQSADPHYITLSGAHLKQALVLFDTDPPDGIEYRTQYLLRVDAARQAHDALGAQLGVAPDTLAQGLA
ncbi:MAG: hypothetical protein WA790_14945 [Sulfitobacter sp.]